ncbi:MAG: helix-turn-helix domain-containing protein [Spirochaetia bacterium]|nr:helix-turn-helix domain-containing protein [Spirochaetia bacterium]
MFEKVTPEEVKTLIKRHGLTGSQVANICGVNPRTVRSWQAPKESNSYRPIPLSAWKLLLIATREKTPKEIFEEDYKEGNI